MAYPIDRIILLDKDDNPLGELAPNEVIARSRYEKINGEHKLTLVTTHPLAEGTRVLTCDGTGKWREHVVNAPDEAHEKGEHAIGTYGCIWSLQYDLTTVYASEHAEPGMGTSCSARTAIECAIDGTTRWTVGTVDVDPVAAGKGVVMIGISAWDRLSLVVGAWHGEVDSEISVSAAGAVTRKVAFLTHLGQTNVTRRFDWGEDVKSIHRIPEPGPYYCRIIPLGRGETEYAEDDETTFEWPIDITEETPHGEDYIQDDEAALVFRKKSGSGYEYPSKVVNYDENDPELLYNAGLADVYNHTRPTVTYKSDVLQFARAGMDVQGVQLGDNVQCSDRGFNPDAPLAIEGRVTEMTVNELAPATDTTLVIGELTESMGGLIGDIVSSAVKPIKQRVATIEGGGTIVYLRDLIDALNQQINASGGYWYAIPGMGTRTYDTAVSNPAVGSEASRAVEVRGGYIRIADSRTSGGDWDWKTLIESGHIAATLVTAAQLTAGYVGDPTGGTFFDLDNGVFYIGGTSADSIARDVSATTYSVSTLQDDMAAETEARTNAVENLNSSLSDVRTDMRIGLDEAKRFATDYIEYNQSTGELTLGTTDTDIKNVMTYNTIEFRTSAGTVTYWGVDDNKIGTMYVETASIGNYLRFGDFAWIRRDNGNMSLKWIGS